MNNMITMSKADFDAALEVARQAGREKAIATLILARPEWEDEIKRIVG